NAPPTGQAVSAGAAPRLVSLYLPRFTDRRRFDLEDVLGKMGMERAFGGGDFTGMYDPRPDVEGVVISKVVHEAFVAVNEEGTEGWNAPESGAPPRHPAFGRPPPQGGR